MPAGKFVIEPFDSAKHDRTAFSCGVQQVDNYFQKTANKLAKADNVRLFVMVAPDDQLVGFYALNSHSIEYSNLPAKFAKTRPGHGHIPAVYISMIGRDQKFKNGGYGTDLLVDALKRIATAADSVGIAVVLLDVLDCGNPEKVVRRKELYAGFGFLPLPADEMRMYLPIETVRTIISVPDEAEAPNIPLETTG
jgi:hypothetical protein